MVKKGNERESDLQWSSGGKQEAPESRWIRFADSTGREPVNCRNSMQKHLGFQNNIALNFRLFTKGSLESKFGIQVG